MGAEKIFKCTGNEVYTIPSKMLEDLQIDYEEGNRDAFKIAILSKELKRYNNKKYCSLPFCHTVEAESFDSTVIFHNEVGNRIGRYAIDDINKIDEIEKINLNEGRIGEVLKSIDILREDGENIILNITGPISIATAVLDTKLFYKAMRKEREKVNKFLSIIEDSIVLYILEATKKGVNIISLADPAGTIDIVGPKMYEDMAGKSIYNILKRVENQLGKTIIHICGKTSTSLEAVGLLETERIEVKGEDYFHRIENIKGERKDIKFIGHWCFKLDKFNDEIINCKIK